MSRYAFNITKIPNGTKVVPYKDQKRITWNDALMEFQTDKEFVGYIIEILKQSSYQSFFWENSPVESSSYYEFVLINAPSLLNARPNPGPFNEFIALLKGTNEVTFFPNIGKDAYLVVPAQNGPENYYTHIGNFVRNAPIEQVYELFRMVGYAGSSLIQSYPKFWISTSGLGVSWLHVRNDLSPKYYSYHNYK